MKLYSKYVILIPILLLSFYFLCIHLIENAKIHHRRKWLNEPPIGIQYISTNKFDLPKYFGICIKTPSTNTFVNPLTKQSILANMSKNYNIIYPPIISESGNEVYFVVTGGETNELHIIGLHKMGTEIIYSGYDIGPCSLYKDKKMAFVAATTEHDMTAEDRNHLVDFDINTKKAEFSPTRGFTGYYTTPPVWLSNEELVVDHRSKGIIQYNLSTQESKVLLGSDYEYPVLWGEKNLIVKKESSDEAYVCNLDGSNMELLFKNQFLDDMYSISPDNKYLACRAKYMADMDFYIYGGGHLVPGASLFLMNLENKTFTYFFANEDDCFGPHISWHPINNKILFHNNND